MRRKSGWQQWTWTGTMQEARGSSSTHSGWNAPWVSNGFPLFTTTLASSRWKDIRQINEAGFYAEEHCGRGLTRFWDRNWRKGGLYERRNILARRFYNQQYCGCEFSLRHSNKNNTLNTTQYEKATGTHG